MSALPTTAIGPKPYHASLVVNGQAVGFAHLEPFHLALFVEKISRSMTVDVRFSNHCFSEGFDPLVHPVSLKLLDHGGRERAFCNIRYLLSARLPDMVRSLPDAAVWLTKREHNYVYFIMIEDGSGQYPMFFNLRRPASSTCDLSMFVESAYMMDLEQMRSVLASAQKIRFPVLCAKVFRGERIRSNVKR